MFEPRERVTGIIEFTEEKLPYIKVFVYSPSTNITSDIQGVLDTGTFPNQLHPALISTFFASSKNRTLVFSFNGGKSGYANEVRSLPKSSGVNNFLISKGIYAVFSPQQLFPSTDAYMIMDFANGQFAEAYGSPEDVKKSMDKSFNLHAKSLGQTFSSSIVKTLELANKDFHGAHIIVKAKFNGVKKETLIDTGSVKTIFSHKGVQPDKKEALHINFASQRLKTIGTKSFKVQLGDTVFDNVIARVGGKGFQNASFGDLKSGKKVSSILGAAFFKDHRTVLAIPFWAKKRPIIIGQYHK